MKKPQLRNYVPLQLLAHCKMYGILLSSERIRKASITLIALVWVKTDALASTDVQFSSEEESAVCFGNNICR